MTDEPPRSDAGRRLEGRSVAIIGLTSFLAEDVAAILKRAGAEVAIGDGSRIASADLVIASPAAASSIEKEKPLLIVGDLETLVAGAGGADHHDFVPSPVRSDELLLRAYRVMSATARHRASATPSVLAVDDDATTTAIVRAVVTRNGMACHVAANGKEALQAARTLKPSVIILDVNMPFVGGFEVLSTLRNDPETASIPVIMLTSVQQEADVVRGFALGADDYVAKPFNPMELLARIRRLVGKS